jgi:hypothetical protein
MKMTLIASTAVLLFSTSLSFAGMPALDDVVMSKAGAGFIHLAKDGGDDGGGDDRGGGDRGGRGGDDRDDDGDDDGDDDRGGDDRGGRAGDDGRRVRVPGGPGCDDAGDIAEHAACSP